MIFLITRIIFQKDLDGTFGLRSSRVISGDAMPVGAVKYYRACQVTQSKSKLGSAVNSLTS